MRRFSDRKICSMPAVELAKLALGRILFSDKGETFKLALCDGENINLKSLCDENLLAVSEVKRNKDGGVDVKFFDILKAAELMFEIGRDENENQESGEEFLKGFLRSARQISSSQTEDESETSENTHNDDASLAEEGKV